MRPNLPPTRYSKASIALHWLMLLLLAAVYVCIELRVQFPRGSDTREALKAWHFMLGLSVLLLVTLRLLARALARTPPITPTLPLWQLRTGQLVHVLLYVLMVLMPLAGWLVLSASGKSIPFFFVELPPLVAPNDVLAEQVKDIHERVGTIGYYLIGLHASAALFHHYVRRDDTLRRMLPGKE